MSGPAHSRRVLMGLFAFVAIDAQAYILPPGSILRRFAEARDELGPFAVRVEGSFSLYGADARELALALGLPKDTPTRELEGSIVLKAPSHCRLDVRSNGGAQSVALVQGGRRHDERAKPEVLAVALAQLCQLLATRSGPEGELRSLIERRLAALKVDYRRVSLARFGGQVAYLLGKPEPGHPQLWLYKDSYLPARVREGHESAGGWDLRLYDYKSPISGPAFPRVIELYRGAQLSLRFTVLRADTRARIDESLL